MSSMSSSTFQNTLWNNQTLINFSANCILVSLPSSPLGLRHSWDFLEGRLCQDGGGGLGGGPPLGGGGREGGGFLVLATMSGSTVNCRGGLVGPDESESVGLSVKGTWSKMSAGLCSCSPSAPTSGPAGWLCPMVLVMSGGWTGSCVPTDGPGTSLGSGAGIEHAPFAVALSGCSSVLSTSWGSTAGTASSTGTSWALFSSFGSSSALTSTWSWSNSWTTSPTFPFWLSSMMLSMICQEVKSTIQWLWCNFPHRAQPQHKHVIVYTCIFSFFVFTAVITQQKLS